MSRGQLHTLRDLSRGAELALGSGGTLLLVRGDHVRGVRWSTYHLFVNLLLVRQGRITEAGEFVLAMGGGR